MRVGSPLLCNSGELSGLSMCNLPTLEGVMFASLLSRYISRSDSEVHSFGGLGLLLFLLYFLVFAGCWDGFSFAFGRHSSWNRQIGSCVLGRAVRGCGSSGGFNQPHISAP